MRTMFLSVSLRVHPRNPWRVPHVAVKTFSFRLCALCNPQNRGGISSESVTRMLLALRVRYPAEFQALPAPETEPIKPN